MTQTHAQKRETAMAHIMAEIFDGEQALLLFTNQIGIEEPLDFLIITPTVILQEKYTDAAGDQRTLTNGEIEKFRTLQGFIRYRVAAKNPIRFDKLF